MLGNSNVIAGDKQVIIGLSNSTTGGAIEQILIGHNNTSSLTGSGVVGHNLTSLWAQGITMNQVALANYANINFADDTAAATGGVPLGGVYHNAGAMRIRIV